MRSEPKLNLKKQKTCTLVWQCTRSVWHSVHKKNRIGSNDSNDISSLFTMATLLLLILPLFTFLQKKRNTTVKTSYRQHDQYQPGRGCLISLVFCCCFEFSQLNWHPHVSGKRQYLCMLFRKSLVDIHSCLTEWQKYP